MGLHTAKLGASMLHGWSIFKSTAALREGLFAPNLILGKDFPRQLNVAAIGLPEV